MAPSRKHKETNYIDVLTNFKNKMKRFGSWDFIKSLVLDPKQFLFISILLILIEVCVNILVIKNVKYTEIDWIAYMQEVEGVVNGTFDYSQLKGDTGPLVYPAGFVYVFGILYYITNYGNNIRFAQYIFGGFYVLLLGLVFRMYLKTKKVPPYAIIIACCSSYRIHSIFVLRMFNDGVATLLVYMALNLFLDNYWSLGSVLFSLAVSVKMNVLLYAPTLLLSYYYSLGFQGTIFQLSICAIIQFVLAIPFLLSNPIAYLKGSFDLGRVFLYQWTVNWRFLPEKIFLSRNFHILLLILHLLLIFIFLNTWRLYFNSFATLKRLENDVKPQLKKKKENVNMDTSSQLFVLPMFTCNFIGVACSRSLHYQFYIWYFHTLPYLLWSTPFPNPSKLIIMGIIELCWNTYPSNSLSSIALHLCHIAILVGLYRSKYKQT